ncbi:DUF2867 domain-containing protein [Burkholderia stabilis]|uniref:DUF2867 domain-containing protein n=1 Tax=Burkholderia stabilis TaxID=95485 RepID=UPI00080B8E29|nr:DUF2867 domain-containing protein [Burkholderia stabilis]
MKRFYIADIPASACLVGSANNLNFLHVDCAPLNGPFTAFEAYRIMTTDISLPLRGAFFLRDKISRLFNVREIKGFSRKRPRSTPLVGGRLDFFTVERIGDYQLVLSSRDRHLAVMVSVDIVPRADGAIVTGRAKSMYVTTSVETYNMYGRLYMVPVAVAHRHIVRKMLRKVEAITGAIKERS